MKKGLKGLCLVACLALSACGGCDETSSSTNNGENNGTANNGTANNTSCFDRDGDGAFAGDCEEATDCDDTDDERYPGADEVCGDGRDNDCDGALDNGCPCTTGSSRLCSSYIDPLTNPDGVTCKPGVQRCVGGTWDTECEGEIGPEDETCDGIDNNCDGDTDEGLLNAVGECLDTNPVLPDEDCGPTGEGNGLDDDGDGTVDEGCTCVVPDYDPALPREGQPCYSGPPQTLGVGLCHGGSRDCSADGIWGMCMGEVLPEQEICGDDLDNDCDGFVDEQCPICTDPVEEVCDGADNDCDGVVDNGVLNACGGCGEVAADDTCGDGLDNDCDGQIDEGCGCTAATLACYPGPPEASGVGACSTGTMECLGEYFGDCEGFVLPGIELCGADGRGDGVDDDCDGVIDDGCGCTEGATRLCGDAAGICTYGTQTCSGGDWGPCTGGTPPEIEICDGLDNDCDGLSDEGGLLNACGTCGLTCYQQPAESSVDGMTDDGAEPISGMDPDNPTGRDGVTLSKNSFIPPYLWAANHTNQSVTKYNTDLHIEEGIYWAANNPSRTAVDLDGNMWVGGRDDGRLTKVLWDTTSCPDTNNNGSIDTSRNIMGVVSQVNSAANPFADECVVYSALPNPALPSIRGVAAGPDGRVWIGYTGGGVQAIDPNTFVLGPYYPPGNAPQYAPDANGVQQPQVGVTGNTGGVYGLVVDRNGMLYTSSYNRNTLARFDTVNGQWDALFTGLECGSYGIAVDAQSRIWMGGWPGCPGIGMFDPATNQLHNFTVPNTVGPTPGETSPVVMNSEPSFICSTGDARNRFCVTGVAVEPETGNVWCSFYPIGYTGRLEVNDADLAQSQWTFIATTRDAANNYLPGVSNDLRGVGFDRNGYAWTLGLGSDRVWKIDPATNDREVTLANGDSIGVGSHYTYSDFTGSTALSFTAPRGFWRYIFDTQFPTAQADSLVVEAYVPVDTALGLRVRALDSNLMPISGWLPPDAGGPQFFDYPQGANQHTVDLTTMGGPLIGPVFEVEARLSSTDPDVRPILHDIELGWQRP